MIRRFLLQGEIFFNHFCQFFTKMFARTSVVILDSRAGYTSDKVLKIWVNIFNTIWVNVTGYDLSQHRTMLSYLLCQAPCINSWQQRNDELRYNVVGIFFMVIELCGTMHMI